MKKFVCRVCAYVHYGDAPPSSCPVCSVGPEYFVVENQDYNIDTTNENDFDFKDYIITDKVKENDIVTSFYLKRKDNRPLKTHLAGQFISIKPILEGEHADEVRQYSLSMKPGVANVYRISIKRWENGIVSKYMHDHVKVGDTIKATNPLGQMVLKDTNKPLVLISGGIGITPMMSMMYQAVRDRDIIFVHACRNSQEHTFKNELDFVKSQNHNLKTVFFYSSPLDSDVLDKDYNHKGYITKEWIVDNLPKDGDFYFCAPIMLMKTIYDALVSMGIKHNCINYEMFGDSKDLANL